MICRQCGTAIADKALICYRCGTPTAPPRDSTLPPRRRRPLVATVAAVVGFVTAGVLLIPHVPAGSPRILAVAGLALITFLTLWLVVKRLGRRD